MKRKNDTIALQTDQYCQYERLPVLLKRYSFEEKMRIATIYSSTVILFGQRKINGPQEIGVFPWCLETFVMLAVEAEEYSNENFCGKNEKKFIKMQNAIWNATTIAAREKCSNFTFIDLFMPVTGLTQFSLQESFRIKYYRYWTIFNNNVAPVFLKHIFREKMGTDYEEFLLLGNLLQILFILQGQGQENAVTQKSLDYLINRRFPKAAQCLRISRQDYVRLQKEYIKDSPDPYKYIYSLRPSYRYAFIEEKGDIYFPLPHLLQQNITSSLLYRITDNDDDLRRKIGKNVWENYLLDLLREVEVYQEVKSEQRYKYHKSESKSPDILIRQGGEVLLIDSKSTVPNIGIRLFDCASYEKNISIIAENIKQLYRQIQRFDLYNPFEGSVSNDLCNFWGVIVVLEDSYIMRNRYYEKAKELLDLEESSVEWRWLIAHIKVISLYEIERISLIGHSLIDAIKYSSKEDKLNYTFMGYPPNGEQEIISKKYLEFSENLNKKIKQIVLEMEWHGIFDEK